MQRMMASLETWAKFHPMVPAELSNHNQAMICKILLVTLVSPVASTVDQWLAGNFIRSVQIIWRRINCLREIFSWRNLPSSSSASNVLRFQLLPDRTVDGDRHKAYERNHEAGAHGVFICNLVHERCTIAPPTMAMTMSDEPGIGGSMQSKKVLAHLWGQDQPIN